MEKGNKKKRIGVEAFATAQGEVWSDSVADGEDFGW